MPNPTYGNIHVDAPLTNISVAYIQKADSFIADKVFPIIPVKKQSDRYFVYLKEDWFRDEAVERVMGAESAGGGYEIDNTPTYFCKIYAYHKDVTAADRANSDIPLQPDEDASQFVSQKFLLRRETDWATRFFATGIWDTEYKGASATSGTNLLYWSSKNSDPIGDVATAQLDIQSVTAFKPNVMVIGPYVYKALRNHADVLDRIKYTQGPAIPTPNLLAQLFDVDKVLVAQAVKNSAAKGATESTDFIYGKHALLAYAAPSPGLKQPTAGYIMAWTGLEGAGAYGNRMYRIPMDHLGLGTTRIEGEMAYDCELVASSLGVFFNGIVA
ncbi:MAG: major capsid protein [Clostridia bacterium]